MVAQSNQNSTKYYRYKTTAVTHNFLVMFQQELHQRQPFEFQFKKGSITNKLSFLQQVLPCSNFLFCTNKFVELKSYTWLTLEMHNRPIIGIGRSVRWYQPIVVFALCGLHVTDIKFMYASMYITLE